MDEDKKEDRKESAVVEERKEKLMLFVRAKYNWIIYIALIALVWFAAWLRSLPMKVNPSTGHPGLWDISTNNWTLGPDLDPFLFLRYTKEIVANSFVLPLIDTFRYVPLGFQTNKEYLLESYIMAYFHKFASALGFSSSIEQSAVIFPIIVFCLGVIAFFFFVRKSFLDELGKMKAGALALISSLFLVIIPALLPRTIAGIPDKQGSFVVFLFACLYFFILSWKAKLFHNQIIFVIISGLIAGLMGLYWGGYFTVFVAVVPTVFIFYLLGKMDWRRTLVYAIWVLLILSVMNIFSPVRFTVHALVTSFFTGSSLALLFVLVFSLVYNKYLNSKIRIWHNVPASVKSLALSAIIIFVMGIVFFGPSYTFGMIFRVLDMLITPAPTGRFDLTVAENRVPYLSEIASSFGPMVGNIPVFFTILLIGSVYFLASVLANFGKREKYLLVGTYIFMIFSILFSRISASSTFNGNNFVSHAFYATGLLTFGLSAVYVYLRYHKEGKSEILNSIRLESVVVIILFFFMLISVKGAIRLVLLLVPPAAIMGSYLLVVTFDRARHFTKNNEETKKFIYWGAFIIVLLGIIYSAYSFYGSSVNLSQNYIPSAYTQQWQLAMGWVRDNTPANAVFAHWWDYGYWVQTMGQRATVLDGGNYYTYWDYLMGRYVLTAPNNSDSFQFLYSHNATHLLIDSTDIGKYPAYSSIGSDENYDRASFMPSFTLNQQQTRESNNATFYVYQGGVALDDDIHYNFNGTNAFLPAGKAGLAGIIVGRDSLGRIASQPVGVYIYQNNQYQIPFRYIYVDGNLTDFKSGLEAGVFIYSAITQSSSGGLSFEKDYSALYLSRRTINSMVARLFLFNENDTYFKLMHSEDDMVVSTLKSQGYLGNNDDFVLYFGELRGPIRIWKINYPAGVQVNQTDLLIDYPDYLQKVKHSS